MFLIILYWILVGLIYFLLWNFRDYLKNKPPGSQTLLDGANIQLIEYFFISVSIFNTVGVSLAVSDNEINETVAEILAWSILINQQLFYYQLLTCGLVRLFIVLNWPQPISDEKILKWLRRIIVSVTIFSTLILILFGYEHPMTLTLQGKESKYMVLKLVPIIVFISFLVQIISRSIIYFKIQINSQESSNELFSSGFYTLVFVIIVISKTFISPNFGVTFAWIFGHFAYLSLCLQILYQSYYVRQFICNKYPLIKEIHRNLSNIIEPMIDVIV